MSANNENGSPAYHVPANEVPSTPTVALPIDIDDDFEDMIGYVAQHVISTLRSSAVIDNGRLVPGISTPNPFLNPAASELIPDSAQIPRSSVE